jgi:hypothetical protein
MTCGSCTYTDTAFSSARESVKCPITGKFYSNEEQCICKIIRDGREDAVVLASDKFRFTCIKNSEFNRKGDSL